MNSGLFQEKEWAKHFGREELQKRMVLLMVNEAARCLEEGIVTEPADVDLRRVVEAWPDLPEAIRRAVLALVQSAQG